MSKAGYCCMIWSRRRSGNQTKYITATPPQRALRYKGSSFDQIETSRLIIRSIIFSCVQGITDLCGAPKNNSFSLIEPDQCV